jgi:thymidine phosphorylase
MNARDLIFCLREGQAVSPTAINAFGSGLGSDAVSDAQAGAFAMACVFKVWMMMGEWP